MMREEAKAKGSGGMISNMLNNKNKGENLERAMAEEKRRIMQIREQQMYISKSGELNNLDKMINGFVKPKKK